MLVNRKDGHLWTARPSLLTKAWIFSTSLSEVMWSELTWFMWSDFVLKWSAVSDVEVLWDKSTMHIRVTLYWGYLIVLWLFHWVCILHCGCFNLFCNVWVCVCVSFVMCGCVYVWVLWCVGVCVYVWVLWCVGVCTCGFCDVWVCVCVGVCICVVLWCVDVCMCGFCNVWLFWQLCGCFGNVYL
jgi:hypothetical protein